MAVSRAKEFVRRSKRGEGADPAASPSGRGVSSTPSAGERAAADRKGRKKGSGREWSESLIIAIIAAVVLRVVAIEAFRIPSGSMESTLLIGDFLLVNKIPYGIYIPFVNVRLVPPFGHPDRGDVIVFRWPPDPEQNYIKRCVGLPGDRIEIHDEHLSVNGQLQPTLAGTHWERGQVPAGLVNPDIFPMGAAWNEDNYGPVVVPKQGDVLAIDRSNLDVYKPVLAAEFGLEGDPAKSGYHYSFDGENVLIDGHVVRAYTVKQDYYWMMGDNRDNSLDSRFWGFVPKPNIVGRAMVVYWSWDPEVGWTHPVDKLASIRWRRLGGLIR